MKNLQRLCAATVFVLLLTSATLAGEIHTPGIAQPSPTPASAIVAGEIPIDESSSTPEGDSFESASLTKVTLSLLQLMLSVF